MHRNETTTIQAVDPVLTTYSYVRQPYEPTLQAGGRRFDPAWLHLKSQQIGRFCDLVCEVICWLAGHRSLISSVSVARGAGKVDDPRVMNGPPCGTVPAISASNASP
jgi:hypothetical protein